MRINVFEGGRRILYLLMACTVIVPPIVAYFQSQYIYRNFEVVGFGAEPVLTSSKCGTDDRTEFQSRHTNKGTSVSVYICFRSMVARNGTRIILTERKADGVYGYQTWQPEVSAYVSAIGDRFKLSAKDELGIDGEASTNRFKDVLYSMFGGIVAAGVLMLLAAIAGWVLRGFLSIPRGQDSRPPAI